MGYIPAGRVKPQRVHVIYKGLRQSSLWEQKMFSAALVFALFFHSTILMEHSYFVSSGWVYSAFRTAVYLEM